MDGFQYIMPISIQNDVESENEYKQLMNCIASFYKDMVNAGIPEEDARYILPNACTTNLVMKINARSLKNFLSLRMCNKAQWEIRELANEMYKLVCKCTPQVAEYMGPPCWFDGCKELNPCVEGRPKAVTMRKE